MENEQQLGFEDALKELENLVRAMEKGELSLDETLGAFEKGVELGKFCEKHLGEAARKVEMLVRDMQSGELKWQEQQAKPES